MIYQIITSSSILFIVWGITSIIIRTKNYFSKKKTDLNICLLYTSDAADEDELPDEGGRRIIKKKMLIMDKIINT
ncbi:hypothetical protein, partial [Escherichia coli]|uniref:hypothetical protein n=1 Tax=Escherichia coli TaxID=562 RepID=UPI001BCFE7D8